MRQHTFKGILAIAALAAGLTGVTAKSGLAANVMITPLGQQDGEF